MSSKIVAYGQLWEACRDVRLMQTKRFVTHLYAALQRKKFNKLLARWERRWKRSVLFNRNILIKPSSSDTRYTGDYQPSTSSTI